MLQLFATSSSGELPTALNILAISEITHLFDHGKASSISQLINGKSRYLQQLLTYFNGTTTSASNILLLFGVLPIIIVFYSKKILLIVLLLFILSLLSISISSSFILSL